MGGTGSGRPVGYKPGAHDKTKLMMVRALRQQGKTLQQIADMYGCSRQSIQQYLKWHEQDELSNHIREMKK